MRRKLKMRKQLFNYISVILLIIISLSSKAFTNSYVNQYRGLRYAVYNSIDSDIGAINVLIRAGSIYDPEKKYGVAYILSKLLKRGGTERFSTNALLNKLDETGIELSTGCSKDFIFISFKFINKEKKDALNLLKEILLHPVFNKKEFLSIKKETSSVITSYRNNNDYLAIHQGAVNLIKNKAYSHSSFGEKKDIKNISIINSNGQIVLKDILHKRYINVVTLQTGIYFLKIETSNHVKFKKIIIE